MKSRIWVKALAALWAAGVPTGAGAQNTAPPAFHFRFQQPQGPYPVGLRVVNQIDRARGYGGRYDELGRPSRTAGRPVQTLVWYPSTARGKGTSPLTWGDYLVLIAGEEGTPRSAEYADRASGYLRSRMQSSLHDPMWAVRDAAPDPGRFPVVIYAPSFNASAFENADLCEYWASHGYVVVASPDLGPETHSMSVDQAGINAQAGDISFLIGYAGTLADADGSEVAVAGYSWGGISNIYAAARDNRIDALIMLDGSARYFPKLVQDSGDVKPEDIAVPLLYFASAETSLELLAQQPPPSGPNVLNALTHADVTIVRMPWMEHPDFAAATHRMTEAGAPGRPPFLPPAPGTREETAVGYAWLARYSLAFLDANLKKEPSAKAFLLKTPSENGVPSHLLSVEHHGAVGVAPTMDAFKGEIGKAGFDHIDDVYKTMQVQTPEFKLDEQVINAWGYQLVADGHSQESIDVMRFNTEHFPKSTNTWDALGEAYRNAGDMQQALKAYRQALVVDPGNRAVQDKLKQYAPGQ